MESGQSQPFKVCTKCAYEWNTLEDLVADMSLRVDGYQVCFERAEEGLFMLTHECPNCQTTLSIPAAEFAHWKTGPDYYALKLLTDECAGHCLNPTNLEPCNAQCFVRWVRDVLQFLRTHQVPQHVDNAESTTVQP